MVDWYTLKFGFAKDARRNDVSDESRVCVEALIVPKRYEEPSRDPLVKPLIGETPIEWKAFFTHDEAVLA